MSRINTVVLGPPITTMDEKRQRMRPLAGRHAHVNNLVGIRPIGNLPVGVRRLLRENIFAVHGRQYNLPAIAGPSCGRAFPAASSSASNLSVSSIREDRRRYQCE